MLFPIFVFGNNRNKRSARGADPTTARTPLATRRSLALGLGRYNRGPRAVRGGYAYAAHCARVIPVIAPYRIRYRTRGERGCNGKSHSGTFCASRPLTPSPRAGSSFRIALQAAKSRGGVGTRRPPMGTFVNRLIAKRLPIPLSSFRYVFASVHCLWSILSSPVILRFAEASDVSLLFAFRSLRRACIM